MNRSRVRAAMAASALALGATVLAPPALAEADAPRDPAAPGTGSATPLSVRPSKPLELSPEPAHLGIGWKLTAMAAVVGGVAFYLRKRGGPRRLEDGRLTIVSRTAVGIRSELVVVNVEGQRLLLGVTPQSIQSLAILDGIEAPAPASEEAHPAAPPASVEQRFAAVLQAADPRPEAARPAAPVVDDGHVAGQARGLLALRRRG